MNNFVNRCTLKEKNNIILTGNTGKELVLLDGTDRDRSGCPAGCLGCNKL